MSRRWWSNDDLQSDGWYVVVLFDVSLLKRVDDIFVLSRCKCYSRIAWICYDDTFLKVSIHRFKMNQFLDYVRIVDIRSYILESGKKNDLFQASLNYINSTVSMRFKFSSSFTFHICSNFNFSLSLRMTTCETITTLDHYSSWDHWTTNETENDLSKFKLNEFEKYYSIDV